MKPEIHTAARILCNDGAAATDRSVQQRTTPVDLPWFLCTVIVECMNIGDDRDMVQQCEEAQEQWVYRLKVCMLMMHQL